MEFKSQICTSRSQSEKLLALGLKEGTADMVWIKELAWDEEAHCTYDPETYILRPIDYLEGESHRGHIPAWSLHRLLEMLYADIGECMIFFPNTYDEIIADIETMIRRGTFNKDYIEEKK